MKIVEVSAGKPYGHVPGHKFEDVDIVVRKTAAGYRAKVTYRRGSAQGYDQVHFEREVSASDQDPAEAVARACERALATGEYPAGYLLEAESLAEEALEEAVYTS